MLERSELRRNYLRDSEVFRQVDPEDIEIAYLLQNMQADDVDTLKRIVHRYAKNLYKWIGVLLFYQQSVVPRHEEILSMLQTTFVYATNHIDQFHGQVSVMDWLFAISFQVVKGNKWNFRLRNIQNSKEKIEESVITEDNENDNYWQSLDTLPDKIRLVFILRYLFDLGISDIAHVLNIQTKDVHMRLLRARKHSFVNRIDSHNGHQIQAYLDGFLDDKQMEVEQIEQHLAECSQCQGFISELKNFEETLAGQMKARREFPSINSEMLNPLFLSIVNEVTVHKGQRKINISLQQTSWIIGFTVTFIGLAILFIRLTPVEREFPQPGKTTTAQLPPIIEILPANTSPRDFNALPDAPQYIEPDFSSDGNWGIFASIKIDPITQATFLPTIELYDRASNTIQVISESTGTLNLPWIWWNLAPSISADGRWIAYVSSSDGPNIAGIACETIDKINCLDIFLHDRETGIVKRITQGVNGEAANGDSLAPTISMDGQWVAFWSSANNLMAGDEITCQPFSGIVTCLSVYLYNQDSGSLERIPISTTPGESIIGVDRISLSANGRFVGFTISAKAQNEPESIGNQLKLNLLGNSIIRTVVNTSILNIGYTTEAIVYDRETGTVEIENQAQDGSLGNGAASSPVLSADGRYVAFVSESTNLIAGDTNQFSDVFVRDRDSGKIELASIDEAGRQGAGNSGLTFWGRGYYSLNMSADGRYVVFQSTAPNLGQKLYSKCSYFESSVCNLLYVYDRQTKQTQWISALPNGDFSFFPKISADGRWISFMQSIYNCNSAQFLCSNVMLYDLENDWLSNLTNYEEEAPKLPWAFSDSLAIPWELWESKALAFSPDGNLLALGGIDSKVWIWQLSSCRNTIRTAEPSKVLDSRGNDTFTTIAFTPNGKWIAAGGSSGTVYIWDVVMGNLLYTISRQSSPVKSLAFSENGSRLVISTLADVSIWQKGENLLLRENSVSYGMTSVYDVEIAPSGEMIATARGDGTVWFQSYLDGQVIGRLGGSRVVVNDLTFSDDGSMFATRTSDGNINLWQIGMTGTDSLTFTPVSTFKSTGYIGTLSFSPDNMYLASTGMVGEVIMWNVPDGKISTISSPVPNGMVNSLAFSKTGDRLASVIDNKVVLWKIPPDNPSRYYIHSAEDSIIDSIPAPVATANDIPELLIYSNGLEGEHLSLEQAQTLLEFHPLIPTHLPKYVNFHEAKVTEDGGVWLHYDIFNQQNTQASLYIFERIIEDSVPPTMTIGASAEVSPVQVETQLGSAPAEYVQGDWLWMQSFTPPSNDLFNGNAHDVWSWDNNSKSQRLRWQQNGLLIALYYQVENPYVDVFSDVRRETNVLSSNSFLSQWDLLQIASGMR